MTRVFSLALLFASLANAEPADDCTKRGGVWKKEPPAIGCLVKNKREGAWTDVRVGVRTRTHDQTSGLHCIRGQGASGAVAWGVEARGREGWRAGARGV